MDVKTVAMVDRLGREPSLGRGGGRSASVMDGPTRLSMPAGTWKRAHPCRAGTASPERSTLASPDADALLSSARNWARRERRG